MNEMIIATRKSKLAQIQADYVIERLKSECNVDSKKLLIVTEGDRKLDISLNKIGGKGLFVKDIELALLEERAHAAVHSMKDVPNELSEEFEIVSITKREDVRDTFISRDNIHFNELKLGARIGTSSLRRALELKELRSDIEVVPIRGNVQTRLLKMESENLDGIVLAAAGLKRLNSEDIITDYFSPEEMLPAVAQGALGIECVKNFEHKDVFKKLEDKDTRIIVEAERSFMKSLNGDCHSAIGVYSQIKGEDLYMIGLYEIDGRLVKKDILGSKYDNILVGNMLGQKILKDK